MKTDLIAMTRGGKTIEVHRTAVSSHQRQGWKVVDPTDLADLAKAGLVELPRQDPEPYEKLIKVSLAGKTVELNMADVKEWIDAGWKVEDQNDLVELVKLGLLVPPKGTAPAEKLVRMIKAGDDSFSKTGDTVEVDPSAVAAHVNAGWKVLES